MDISTCEQAINTVLQVDVFVSVFLALISYDVLSFLLCRFLRFVDRKQWGAAHGGFDGE